MSAIYSGAFWNSAQPRAQFTRRGGRTFSELHGIDRVTINRAIAAIWFPPRVRIRKSPKELIRKAGIDEKELRKAPFSSLVTRHFFGPITDHSSQITSPPSLLPLAAVASRLAVVPLLRDEGWLAKEASLCLAPPAQIFGLSSFFNFFARSNTGELHDPGSGLSGFILT